MKTFHSQEMPINTHVQGRSLALLKSTKDAGSRIKFTEKSDFKMYMRSMEGGEGLAQQGMDS